MLGSSIFLSKATGALLCPLVLFGFQGPLQTSSDPTRGTVLPFAIASGGNSATNNACPTGKTATLKGVTEEEQTEIVQTIRQAMMAALERSELQRLQPGADGSLTFTGCIVRMEAGSKAKRVIGMTMGASFLSAHIRVLKRQAGTDVTSREYDVEIKGENAAPPVFGGAIYNAVHNKKVSVQADATKLANRAVAVFLDPKLQESVEAQKSAAAQ